MGGLIRYRSTWGDFRLDKTTFLWFPKISTRENMLLMVGEVRLGGKVNSLFAQASDDLHACMID